MSTILVACRIPQGLAICGTTVIGPNNAPKERSLAGFGVTEVDKQEWDKWLAGHHDSDIIKQKMLIAHEDRQQLWMLCRQEMRKANPTGFGQGSTTDFNAGGNYQPHLERNR